MSKILFCQFIGFIKDDKIERYTMLFFSYKIHTKYMYLNSFLSFQIQLIHLFHLKSTKVIFVKTEQNKISLLNH